MTPSAPPTGPGPEGAAPSTGKVYDYYATAVAGLEDLVVADLRERLKAIGRVRVERGRRHGRVRFRYERSPRRLLELRSVENCFALVGEVRNLTVGPSSLDRIAEGVRRMDWGPALALWNLLHGVPDPPAFVATPHLDRDSRYGPGDVCRTVQSALSPVLGLPADPGHPAYNIHLHFDGDRALVGLQLLRGRAWKRPYRRDPRPGSLEGTVAYLMARLAGAGPQDRVLDPLCGAGTILIERGLTGPAGMLLGGDLDGEALAAARGSADAAGVPVRLARWDAALLPLEDRCLDRVLANLPFGKKVHLLGERGTPELLLREMARVLRPGGLIVLLAGDPGAVEGAVAAIGAGLRVLRAYRTSIRGVRPALFVMRKA